MSFPYMQWVALPVINKPGPQALLRILSYWAHECGLIEAISVPMLARMMCVSIRTVNRRLAFLREVGLLTTQMASYDDDGRPRMTGQLHRTAKQREAAIAFNEAQREGRRKLEPHEIFEYVDSRDSIAHGWVFPKPGCDTSVAPSLYESKEDIYIKPTHRDSRLQACESEFADVVSEEATEDDAMESEATKTETGEPTPNAADEAKTEADDRGFAEFKTAYPLDSTMELAPARREFLKLSPRQRAQAISAAGKYRQALQKRGKRARDAAKWLAARDFLDVNEIERVQATRPNSLYPPAMAVFVRKGTPAWEAWDEYKRAYTGKGLSGLQYRDPVSQTDGWRFPSLFPPGSPD